MSNVVAFREQDPSPLEQAGTMLPTLPEDVQRLLDAEAEAALPDTKWAQSLKQLTEHQEATFRRMGHDETLARRLARASILALAEYGGGKQWYLPKGDHLRLALRDIEIFRRATRHNIEALAKEYRLTVQTVYRIIHAQRRLHVARRQRSLPFADTPATPETDG